MQQLAHGGLAQYGVDVRVDPLDRRRLRDPAVRETLGTQGLVPGGGTSAAFKAYIAQESRTWGAIIRRNGITID